jgi:hypothetical protein
VSPTNLADNFLHTRNSFRQNVEKTFVIGMQTSVAACGSIGLIQHVDVGNVLHAAYLSFMLEEQDD